MGIMKRNQQRTHMGLGLKRVEPFSNRMLQRRRHALKISGSGTIGSYSDSSALFFKDNEMRSSSRFSSSSSFMVSPRIHKRRKRRIERRDSKTPGMLVNDCNNVCRQFQQNEKTLWGCLNEATEDDSGPHETKRSASYLVNEIALRFENDLKLISPKASVQAKWQYSEGTGNEL